MGDNATPESAGLGLLRHVWYNRGITAWVATNHCMRDALRLAIGANLAFEAADLDAVSAGMRSHDWIGDNGWEFMYALAVGVRNRTFIKAYEAWTEREPYFANQVTPGDGEDYLPRISARQRERLALGSTIGNWRTSGIWMKVTSIDRNRVVVCEYAGDDPKPKRIHRLTHEEVARRWPPMERLKAKC